MKRPVFLVGGQTSNQKVFRLASVPVEQARTKLDELLNSGNSG